MTPTENKNSISTIQWDGEPEHWTYPLSAERESALAAHHACTDGGMVSVVAVAPAGMTPDMILSLPALEAVIDGLPPSEETDGIEVRFGRMPLAALDNLPEHGGW